MPMPQNFSLKKSHAMVTKIYANLRVVWKIITSDELLKKYFFPTYETDKAGEIPELIEKIIGEAGLSRKFARLLTTYVDAAPPYNQLLNAFISHGLIEDLPTRQFLLGDIEDIRAMFEDDIKAQIQALEDARMEKLSAAAEAPKNAPLGMIAFSPDRLDKMKGLEQNTKREDALYRALKRHVEDNIKLSEEETKLIKSLMKKGYYENIFKAPEVDKLYRGMGIPIRWLAKILGLKKGERLKNSGSADVNFLYRPRVGSATSWTKRKSVAADFTSMRAHPEGYCGIIFTAYTADNDGSFVDMNGGLYKVYPFDGYSDEKEVIGLGRIRVGKVEWKLF